MDKKKQLNIVEPFFCIDSKFILSKINEKVKNKNRLLEEMKHLESILDFHQDILNSDEIVELRKQLLKIDKQLNRKTLEDEFSEFIYSVDDLKYTEKFFWLVKDIIPSNSIGVFYGASGSGKTTLIIYFIAVILQKYSQIYICYIDGDMGINNIAKSGIAELLELFGARFVYSGKKYSGNFSHTAQRFINKIVQLQQENQDRYYLLVEDSLNLVAKKKNGFIDVDHLYKLEKKLRDAGGGVIVIHHTNKQGTFADSQQIENYADYMFKVTRNDFNQTLLLEPIKASRYEIKEHAYLVEDRKIVKEVMYKDVNISAKESEFVQEVQAILDDLGELNQSELLKELQSTLNSLKVGIKRATRWLEKWAEDLKWCRERRPEQKNAVFYYLKNCQSEKLQNTENIDIKGI